MTDPTPPDVLTEDDHARGCAGREYACTCGYDQRMHDEIKRLRAEAAPPLSNLVDWRVGTKQGGPHEVRLVLTSADEARAWAEWLLALPSANYD